MLVIRNAETRDLEALVKLAAILNSVNFPNQPDVLKEQLELSETSFAGRIKDPYEGHYIFVAEDTEGGEILGSSMIFSRHGSPLAPHYYFEVLFEERYSHTLKKGFKHQILRLRSNEDGPTELGGFVIHPHARGKGLGRPLSYVRLMYIGLHREKFKERILAELLPPLTEEGKSLLWEAYGNKFTALSYKEADYLSRKNKEFIGALFPQHDVYTCLFPPEVQEVIGEVGKDTVSVKAMLEEAGLRYLNQLDPFDGGPHFGAHLEDIRPLKELKILSARMDTRKPASAPKGLVAVEKGHNFKTIVTVLHIENDEIFLEPESMKALDIAPLEKVASMPLKM
ncbi:MAG: arginine N-succinyltransferase [Candidatus Tectomicrobia bacterium]|uniref:Arginine N-succinyltransferase n=1 Tax=Tectimicrobiota bacterium TaxID=2528274 RepID=A0A933LQJ0_UNCTE|nr:arginine N-succinyltransferase [Candidatus Tectomicrobia bacterium]